MNLYNLLRNNIKSLEPYSSARDEFSGNKACFLDANENPFGSYNRYPDPYQSKLKTKISELKKIPANQIFIGNGSDEVIDIALRLFCEPHQDQVLICPPTYGMYKVSAQINAVKTQEIPLTTNFQLDINPLLSCLDTNPNIKLIFLCSPNNPTGNTLNHIEIILNKFKGIVVLDEAYIDFCQQPSWLTKLQNYPNLIICQTLSKAWGKAALRIGLAFANPAIIRYFNKIKPPYNVSKPNQDEALNALNNNKLYQEHLDQINMQKTVLLSALSASPLVENIYPSEANFFLVKTTNANTIYKSLLAHQVVVRNRHSVLHNCLRISVGTPQENQMLIEALYKIRL